MKERKFMLGFVFLILLSLVGCIEGTVTYNGTGLEGVTVTASGASSATVATDADGKYIFEDLPVGTYVVRPEHNDFIFAPLTREVVLETDNSGNVIKVSGVDFQALNRVPYDSNYLIITPDSLFDSALNLFEYRKSSGYKASIVKLSDISTGTITTDDIDAWIELYASINNNLKYVVLIGDVSLLPSFEDMDRDQFFYSDLKYFVDNDVYETDYISNYAYGRIPARNSSELEKYINKVIQFESTISGRNTVAAFYDDVGYDAYLARDLGEAVNAGYETLDIGTPIVADDLYPILNSNADNFAMLIYYGHGSTTSNLVLRKDNLNLWENTDYPVIYFSGGCGFNDYSTQQPIGAALLFADGGSVASIGAAVNGGYGHAYYFSYLAIGMSKTNGCGSIPAI